MEEQNSLILKELRAKSHDYELLKRDHEESKRAVQLLQAALQDHQAMVIIIIIKIYCHQCCGSGMFIPDSGSNFFPSRIRTVSIPDPGSASKNLSILTQKKKNGFKALENMIRVVHPGSWIRILDPDPDFLPIPDPGSRGQKGTGSRIRIRNTDLLPHILSIIQIDSLIV